jgi:hypothetical protein
VHVIDQQAGRQRRHGKRGPILEADLLRQPGQHRGWDRQLLGERSDPHERRRDEAEHALALIGLPGEVPPLDLRKVRGAAHVLEPALGARQIPRAEPGGADGDRNLPLARLGVGHL